MPMWIKRFFAAFLVFVPALVYAYGNTMLALVIPPPPKVVTGGSITDRTDLVAYYTFETDLGDESGGSDDLTAAGGAARSTSSPLTGIGSLLLDGTGDYVKRDDTDLAADFPLKNGTTNNSFTFCAQFNLDAVTQETIISKSDDDGEESLLILVLAGDIKVLHGYNSGASYESVTQESNLSTGTKYAVCYSENSSQQYIVSTYNYTSGDLAVPNTTGEWSNAINIEDGPFSIGAQKNGAAWAKDADGKIDEVAVFNSPLAADEMVQYFENSWEEETAGCEPNYEDAFGSDSITAGDWVEYSGDWSVSGGALVPPDSAYTNFLIFQESMGSIVHGASVSVSDLTSQSAVVLRSSQSGAGYKYVIKYVESSGKFVWDLYNGSAYVNTVQSADWTLADGGSWVASIDDDLVVRIWVNSVNQCPFENSKHYVDKDGDGDGDFPDIMFTSTPTVLASGQYVGLFSGGTATRTFDDFAAFALNTSPDAPPEYDAAYYVTQDGAGAGDGSNIDNAYSVASLSALSGDYSNDVFYLSGPFSTRLVLTGIYGTSSGQVTFDGYESGDCDPIASECTGSAQLNDGMAIGNTTSNHPDYITVQDFRMTRTTGTDPCFYIVAPSGQATEHLIVRRNYVHETNGTIFYAWKTNYMVVQNNKFVNFGQNGTDAVQAINLVESDYMLVQGNEFGHNEALYPSGCTSANIVELHGANYGLIEYNNIYGSPNQAGISYKEDHGGNTHQVFRFNKVHNTNGGAVGFGGNSSSPCSYFYAYGNNIYHAGHTGYSGGGNNSRGFENDYYASHVYIFSNIINDVAYSGYGAYLNTGGYIYLFNNTIVRNGDRGPDPNQIARGGINPNSGDPMTILNNIFWYNRPLATTYGKYNQVYLHSGPVYEHNTYYHPDSSNDNTSQFWYTSGSFKNILQIQALGHEDDAPAGAIRNPLFTDPNGADDTYGTYDDDYTLQAGSPEIDAALDVGSAKTVVLSGGDDWFSDITGYSTIIITLSEALDPDTDWTGQPSATKILTLDRDTVGWDRGAYAYE